SVFLPSGATVGANIYAPSALVSCGGDLEMFGAVVADRFSFGASVSVHYDEAISGGRGCAEPTGSACVTCLDCSGAASAWKANTWSSWPVAADCCPPLSCVGGACVP